jgi:adenosylcobinamide-GDP ribazoletransferase
VLHDFRLALAFLTRLPGGAHPSGAEPLTRAVGWFPAVGLLIGTLAALFHGVLLHAGPRPLAPPLAAAALTLAFTAIVTGGFHEDGLADSFDALAGGRTPEQRLAILDDSRHGTFGVLALVLVTLVKASALAELSGWDAALALVAAHGSGRAGAVVLMGVAPLARPDGLGADYGGRLSRWTSAGALLVGVGVLWAAFGADVWWVTLVVAAGVGSIGLWACRRIGGVTGDLLGAAVQVAECLILLAAAA